MDLLPDACDWLAADDKQFPVRQVYPTATARSATRRSRRRREPASVLLTALSAHLRRVGEMRALA